MVRVTAIASGTSNTAMAALRQLGYSPSVHLRNTDTSQLLPHMLKLLPGMRNMLGDGLSQPHGVWEVLRLKRLVPMVQRVVALRAQQLVPASGGAAGSDIHIQSPNCCRYQRT